jgi:hypothetical protein
VAALSTLTLVNPTVAFQVSFLVAHGAIASRQPRGAPAAAKCDELKPDAAYDWYAGDYFFCLSILMPVN